MGLTKIQLVWIFRETYNFALRWQERADSGKLSDADWKEMVNEEKQIIERSRNNPFCRALLMDTMAYFEENGEEF